IGMTSLSGRMETERLTLRGQPFGQTLATPKALLLSRLAHQRFLRTAPSLPNTQVTRLLLCLWTPRAIRLSPYSRFSCRDLTVRRARPLTRGQGTFCSVLVERKILERKTEPSLLPRSP